MSAWCQTRKSLLHSITSSALVSTAKGTLRSRDLAILRFKANSNTVGRSIGISPGATPRNICAIWSAERLRSAVRLGPYTKSHPPNHQ